MVSNTFFHDFCAMKHVYTLLITISLLLAACSPARRLNKSMAGIINNSAVFTRSYSGFIVQDAETGKVVYERNADQYFTPASCTKILTLGACLALLPDTLTRLYYRFNEGDSADPFGFFAMSGGGDPTWLHFEFQAWQPKPTFLFEHPYAHRYLLRYPPQEAPRWGKGWAWDDFTLSYSPEITDLPLYGNLMHLLLKPNGRWQCTPRLVQDSLIELVEGRVQRQHELNGKVLVPTTYHRYKVGDVVTAPLFNPRALASKLLNDSLKLEFLDVLAPELPPNTWRVCPVDTVYRNMMHRSNNGFAEQLLLSAALEHNRKADVSAVISWAKDTLWAGLPNQPHWVDGSGLSRYNLVTPRYLAGVLNALWEKQGPEKLFKLFPAGGRDGTLVDWYPGLDGEPYVYAKSGSMGGVQCLSGYLVGKSGKVLIFAFMNNHFTGSGKVWKEEMQRVLEEMREAW